MNVSYGRVLRCLAPEARGEGETGLRFRKPEAGWWDILSTVNSRRQRIWWRPCPDDRTRPLPRAFSREQPVRPNTGLALSFLMGVV